MIADAISLPASKEPFFMAGDIAANLGNVSDYPFNVPGIFDAGVNSGGIVKTVAAHYYQVSGGALRDLLNHTSLVTGMAVQKSWRDYLAAKHIPLIMDEANVLSGPTNETLMSTLGSAVWRVDYFMYCMSIGIQRVHYESVFGSNQSMWQPYANNGSPQQTRGGYYSYIPTADFIGNAGGTTQVSQIQVDGMTDGAKFVAYAAYNGTTPARLALINFNEWSSSEALGPRGNTTINLTGLGKGTTKGDGEVLDASGGRGRAGRWDHVWWEPVDAGECGQGGVRRGERHGHAPRDGRGGVRVGPVHDRRDRGGCIERQRDNCRQIMTWHRIIVKKCPCSK